MTNNDVLRSFRYALDLKDSALLACFADAGPAVTPAQLTALLRRDEDPGFEPLSDELLAQFLDGFVSTRRGKRDAKPGEVAGASPELTNNRILRAVRIGLELKDTDVIEIMQLADTAVSKTELSALFRREDHRNYQPCGNQFLRSFLKGLALWSRARSRS